MRYNNHGLDRFPLLLSLLSSLACTQSPRMAEIHAKDYAFVAPATLSSGKTTFRFINDGSVLHEVQLFQFRRGTSPEAAATLLAAGPLPDSAYEGSAPFSSPLRGQPLVSKSSCLWDAARCMACCVSSGMPTPCPAIPRWACGPSSELSESHRRVAAAEAFWRDP
jgi:hypothetical protein